jgi:hypothetical protein
MKSEAENATEGYSGDWCYHQGTKPKNQPCSRPVNNVVGDKSLYHSLTSILAELRNLDVGGTIFYGGSRDMQAC